MAYGQPKPDPILVRDQLQALQHMYKNQSLDAFVCSTCWILAKNPTPLPGQPPTRLIPFGFNRIQQEITRNLGRNNLLVKARQIGGTVYFALTRLLIPAVVEGGIGSLLISQNNEYVEKHFQIIRRAWRCFAMQDPYNREKNTENASFIGNLLHTEYSNKRELIFDQLDSRVMVASAEVEESAQGVTLHHIVADEYSRWPGNPENTLSNVRGALVPEGTTDKNCTANGAAGPFYEDVLRALHDPKKSDAKLHYFDWWWTDEYTQQLSEKEKTELEADLQADERRVIAEIHRELEGVSYVDPPRDVVWQHLGQIAWRRQMKLEQRGNFEEKYPEDIITAFLVTGRQYFDRDVLIQRKRELVFFKPLQTFRNGQTRIFKSCIPGKRYVIGADPASGRDVGSDTDNAAFVVLDVETGEEMAAGRGLLRPEDLAYDIAELGHYYNDAWAAIERTGDGGACILVLAGECKYPAIMKFKEWHKRERGKMIEFEGFPTTVRTRPVALNFLNRHVVEHPELIWDMQFIDEALVFVRNEKGIPAATEGAKDDTVAARWIAHMARQYLLGYWSPLDRTSEKYTPADRLVGIL